MKKVGSLNLLSVEEIVEALEISNEEVVELIEKKKLRAKKIGSKYVILDSSLEDYLLLDEDEIENSLFIQEKLNLKIFNQEYLKVFPHKPTVFPTVDSFEKFLGKYGKSNSLLENGEYLLGANSSIGKLVAGTKILFRYGDEIYGEGIINQGNLPLAKKIVEDMVEYTQFVKFDVESIKIYTAPINITEFLSIENKNDNRRSYMKFLFSTYSTIVKDKYKYS